MKRVTIKNLNGEITHQAELNVSDQWIADGIASNYWGLLERPELDEMGNPTGVILPATYQIEVKDLDTDYDYQLEQCHMNRRKAYPPIADYMDGLVKNDQEQITKYIADCQAVKLQFPKPQR